MDHHHQPGNRRESEPQCSGDTTDPRALSILRRYSAGELSGREAARALGPNATEHDVFAGILAAHLPLPRPDEEEEDRQVAALHALYGPHFPHMQHR